MGDLQSKVTDLNRLVDLLIADKETLRKALDKAIEAFDPMQPDWPSFEKSVVALREMRAALKSTA